MPHSSRPETLVWSRFSWSVMAINTYARCFDANLILQYTRRELKLLYRSPTATHVTASCLRARLLKQLHKKS